MLCKQCIRQRNLIPAVNCSTGKSRDLSLLVRISNRSGGRHIAAVGRNRRSCRSTTAARDSHGRHTPGQLRRLQTGLALCIASFQFFRFSIFAAVFFVYCQVPSKIITIRHQDIRHSNPGTQGKIRHSGHSALRPKFRSAFRPFGIPGCT